VEYRIDGITQIQVDELHHLHFAEGVKSMLRLDPDYLMVGEIRDADSAKAAVMAAISGRVLLSTIHSRDAVGVLMLLRNWGIADHEIVEALSVVVVQRLVRTLCPHCRRKIEPAEKEIRWLQSLGLEIPDQVWEPVGCKECHSLGYKGRTGVFELWRLDESDYRLVLDHCDEHTIKQHLIEKGHTTFLEDALMKTRNGTTTLAELRKTGAADFQRRGAPQINEKKKRMLKG
jgi:general secretion pathway protein E